MDPTGEKGAWRSLIGQQDFAVKVELMFGRLASGLRKTFLFDIGMFAKSLRMEQVRHWEKSGRPVPPPHSVKQRVVKQYAQAFSLGVLLETGTYMGTMVHATRNTFERIFSIELDTALSERATDVFRRFRHISIIQGDSGEVLPDILARIDAPCLFWLDGHYSGGATAKGGLQTPITRELDSIFRHTIPDHVILVDDARLFVGSNDYPTLDELRELVEMRWPGRLFQVKNDIIRVHRKVAGFEPSF